MKSAIVCVLVLVSSLVSCPAADQASARKAVDEYLPDAATPLKEGIVASLSALPEGGTLNITALGRTVSFHVLFGQVIGKEGTIAEQPAVAALDAAARPWRMTPSALGWGVDGSPYPDKSIPGPDGGTYVWVPAGDFNMGQSDEQSPPERRPAHRVRISRGFWLGKHEVTNEQYQAFCKVTKRQFPESSRTGAQHPVSCVTWVDAKAYCTQNGLSLPTEAQWEYAARGPDSLRYPWGDDWDPKRCCWGGNRGPDEVGTLEVGSIPTGDSWCGASDLSGNVWEWCYDLYDAGYYARSPVEDPEGASSGTLRVYRGGSWRHPYAFLCESASRDPRAPDDWRGEDIGFRCAIVPQ